MSISRRDLGLLLPALAAARATAQQSATVETMTSKAYPSDRIPYRGDDHKKGRQFFLAATHAGFKIECHDKPFICGPERSTTGQKDVAIAREANMKNAANARISC